MVGRDLLNLRHQSCRALRILLTGIIDEVTGIEEAQRKVQGIIGGCQAKELRCGRGSFCTVVWTAKNQTVRMLNRM